MMNDKRQIKILAPLALAVVSAIACIFIFSFVYSINPTGSAFDNIKFSQVFISSEDGIVPRLIKELQIFCLVSFGSLCISIILYGLKIMAKTFKGISVLFTLSIISGLGCFLLMRLGLSEMISDGVSLGISWYFGYASFALVTLGFFINKSPTTTE